MGTKETFKLTSLNCLIFPIEARTEGPSRSIFRDPFGPRGHTLVSTRPLTLGNGNRRLPFPSQARTEGPQRQLDSRTEGPRVLPEYFNHPSANQSLLLYSMLSIRPIRSHRLFISRCVVPYARYVCIFDSFTLIFRF
jgi:hypothetical protein